MAGGVDGQRIGIDQGGGRNAAAVEPWVRTILRVVDDCSGRRTGRQTQVELISGIDRTAIIAKHWRRQRGEPAFGDELIDDNLRALWEIIR